MGNSFIFDDEEPEQPEDMEAETEAGGEEPAGDEGGNNRTFLLTVGALGVIVCIALLCLAVYAGFWLPRQRQAAAAQQAAQLVQNTQIAQAATETAIAAAGSSYTVQLGETLAAIAARFGVALEALRNANPGVADNPTPGTIIIVPIQGGGSSYTVQPGDTLLAIAARFGITVDDLRNANPGVGDTPTPGQNITIPDLAGLLPSPEPSVTSTPVVVFPTSTPVVVATVNPITATVAAAYTQAALAQLTVVPTSTALGAVPSTGFADEVGLPLLLALGAVFLVVIFVVRRVRTAQ